jgi:hypothetical protein
MVEQMESSTVRKRAMQQGPCKKCPPAGAGHGPYWYGFYWDYEQPTLSFYVGKQLSAGVELIVEHGTDDTLGDSEPPR